MASLPPKSKAPVTPMASGLRRPPRQVRVDVVNWHGSATVTGFVCIHNCVESGIIRADHWQGASGIKIPDGGIRGPRYQEPGPTGYPLAASGCSHGHGHGDSESESEGTSGILIRDIRNQDQGLGWGYQIHNGAAFSWRSRVLAALVVFNFKLPLVPKQSLPVGPCSPCH